MCIRDSNKKIGRIMPKMKTKKCAAKRFSKTGTGKLKRNHMGGSHILSNKNRKRKRVLRSSDIVEKADMKRITPFI